MVGFFTKKEIESQSKSNGKIISCISCGRYKGCNSPKMKPSGEYMKKILIIGSTPNYQDDKYGLHFQGKAGKLLKQTLASLGVDLTEDCLLTYSAICRAVDGDGDERVPTNYEIQCCRKFILQTIKEQKPKIILLLGDSALFSIIGDRWQKDLDNIHKWRGFTIPDQEIKAWLCPIYNPKYVQELSEKRPEILTIWKADIENALSKLKDKFPVYQEPLIEYLEPEDLPVLSTIKDDFAFDYETTGLKPHAEGHQIICASVAYEVDKAYSFMMPKNPKARKPFTDLLQNPRIGKIAQNMKFEDTWTSVRLGVPVVNWVWDTMLASHIFDNRQGVTGLKFQTYVQFGIIDYDSNVSPFLKSLDQDNKNSINQIIDIFKKPRGKEMLLKYCGLDSIYEYRLACIQRPIIELPF